MRFIISNYFLYFLTKQNLFIFWLSNVLSMVVTLDAKDRKLLAALDYRARDTLTALAKTVGTSKQSVDYKLKRLEKLGVIQGYYPIVDSFKLGYLYCRLILSLSGATPGILKRMVVSLRKEKRLFWLLQMQGRYDLFIAFWVKDIEEFRHTIGKFLNAYGGYVRHRNEDVVTALYHLQQSYFFPHSRRRSYDLRMSDKRLSLDGTDRRMLSLLSLNARTPLVSLSQKLGITAVAVARRIRKLETNGVITGYRPIIDHAALGYGYYKIFLNLSIASDRNMHDVKAYLSQQPLVLYIIDGIGLLGDIDFEMVAKSPLELNAFMNGLREAFPGIIADYEAMQFPEVLQVKYHPF
jgi:DNA-binding Lrp family transcriptional regulator